MENEIKVTTEVLEEVGEATKGVDWKSIGKKGGAVVLASAVTYLGVKYIVKPLVKKFFKKEETSGRYPWGCSEDEEIDVTEVLEEEAE